MLKEGHTICSRINIRITSRIPLFPTPWCPLSPFSRAHLSSPPSLAPEDAPSVSWAASDGFWSGWLPHLGCARCRRPASGQSWSHHGTWDRPGRDADALEGRGSRGMGFGTRGDENFGIRCDCNDLVSNLYNFMQKAKKYKMSAYFFRQNFESREFDCTIVSGALNNRGIDSSFVSKVLVVALEDAFLCIWRYFHSEILDMGEWACIAGHPDVWRSAFQCSDDSWWSRQSS